MSAARAPIFRFREFDSNGDPLAGGKVYSYLAGTSTPASTYADATGLVANTNPLILDAEGRGALYLGAGSYKIIVKDADGVVQYTEDDVTAPGSSPSSSPWTKHDISDNQAATDLDGETIDFDNHTSALYDYEITRGTTVIANGQFAIQNLNGTGRLKTGTWMAGEAHGVTLSISQTGTVCQLLAATSSGPGAGQIKLRRQLIPIFA